MPMSSSTGAGIFLAILPRISPWISGEARKQSVGCPVTRLLPAMARRVPSLAGEAFAEELKQAIHRRHASVVGHGTHPADELSHCGGPAWRGAREAERLLALGVAKFHRDRPLRKAV